MRRATPLAGAEGSQVEVGLGEPAAALGVPVGQRGLHRIAADLDELARARRIADLNTATARTRARSTAMWAVSGQSPAGRKLTASG